MTRLLAGDVGGTKTLLLLVDSTTGGIEVLADERFASDAFPSLEAMLHTFLATHPGEVDRAVFGVAGPVTRRTASVTNLQWSLDASTLESALGIRAVEFINDFYAVAVGIPALAPESLVTLNAGTPDGKAPVSILGAGTGLGEAVLVVHQKELIVLPSEGGHADFAPIDDEGIEVLRLLRRRFGRVSYERVISGHGIGNIFAALRELRYPKEPAYAAMAADEQSLAARVSELALEGDPLAKATMRIFIRAYAAEAGNMALRSLSRGGVYLAGGIAPKNLELFTDGLFLETFFAKGRFESLMREMPVHIITDPRVGLAGALGWAGRVG